MQDSFLDSGDFRRERVEVTIRFGNVSSSGSITEYSDKPEIIQKTNNNDLKLGTRERYSLLFPCHFTRFLMRLGERTLNNSLFFYVSPVGTD